MQATQHISRETILRELRTKFLGKSLVVLEKCSSTNDVASDSARHGAPHGLTVIAEEQTAGRGRLGRRWLSPKGGIWLSIVLRDALSIDAYNSLPLTGALAVARTLNSSLGVGARVRWPNDVLASGRKLAGVLVEAKSKGDEFDYALLGVGINANFPISLIEEVDQESTSLLDLVGSPVSREALITTILSEVEYLNELVSSKHSEVVVKLLERLECSRGKIVTVRLQRGEISGVFDGYDGLAKVRVATREGNVETINTSAVISAEYRKA